MHRRILGISAIALFLAAAVLWAWWPKAELPLASCWRGGAILAAAWLAYNDIQRLPNWLLLTFPVVLVVLVRWPRLFPILLGVLLAAAFLRRLLGLGDTPRRR